MEVQFCSVFLDKIASGIPEGKPLSKQEKRKKESLESMIQKWRVLVISSVSLLA